MTERRESEGGKESERGGRDRNEGRERTEEIRKDSWREELGMELEIRARGSEMGGDRQGESKAFSAGLTDLFFSHGFSHVGLCEAPRYLEAR